jgi:hypothetical protein
MNEEELNTFLNEAAQNYKLKNPTIFLNGYRISVVRTFPIETLFIHKQAENTDPENYLQEFSLTKLPFNFNSIENIKQHLMEQYGNQTDKKI